MMKSILVVAAHPDDEVLGCGGTIAKLVGEGAKVHIAFLADGVLSRTDDDQEFLHDDLNVRRAAAKQASQVLRVESVSFGDFPDNRMDTIALLEVVKMVESLIDTYQPDTVFTHHAGDLNIDHRIINQAVTTACRPQKGHPVKSILCFEVPSSTEWQLYGNTPAFLPNWYVDISDKLITKLAALDAYASELRDWPHPRSRKGVEYLANWRGATVGMLAAEAFMLGRHLE